jgi:hypothetical protein
VRDVFVGGMKIVENRRHKQEESAREDYRRAVKGILSA